MTPAELHAKAQRAAEWWEATGRGQTDYDAYFGWCISENGDSWADDTTISDRMLIAFCEDRGWKDDHVLEPKEMVEADDDALTRFASPVSDVPVDIQALAEFPADGVEWRTRTVDSSIIQVGKDPIDVCVHNAFAGGKKWGWSVARYEQVKARGTAPTREEARRQAVKAARAMGKEGE